MSTRHPAGRDLASPRDRISRLHRNVTAEALQARLMEAERACLDRTFAALTASRELPHAASLILASRRKFIAGAGKSAAYASLLHTDLAPTVPNVQLIDGVGLASSTVLSDVRSSDVLVAFSLRRYRTETVRLGRLFARAGGSLVVSTDTAEAPLAGCGSALVLVDTDSASYVDSPTAMAAVCNVLSTLTTASSKGARRRLDARDEVAESLKMYWDQCSDDPGPTIVSKKTDGQKTGDAQMTDSETGVAAI